MRTWWPHWLCRLDLHRWRTMRVYYGSPVTKVQVCVNRYRGCIAERNKG